jgi:hypothetical protein
LNIADKRKSYLCIVLAATPPPDPQRKV